VLEKAVRAGIRGGALYDALIAATAAGHGAEVVSADGRALTTYRAMRVEVRFVESDRLPRYQYEGLRPLPSLRSLPNWYHNGMSKQIAVRLPDDLVEFVDEVVDSGAGRSRAVVVTRALERERRRVVAARDAEILARSGPDPEFAGLAEHVVGMPSKLA
jgi:Arc/MetJ-type ribon-helix-helix transcriptional regulator